MASLLEAEVLMARSSSLSAAFRPWRGGIVSLVSDAFSFLCHSIAQPVDGQDGLHVEIIPRFTCR